MDCVNDVTITCNFITHKGHVTAYLCFIFKINFMPILNILLVLIVVGVVLWLVNTYIPMDGKIKKILNIVVVILLVIWLLQVFGLWDSLKGLRM